MTVTLNAIPHGDAAGPPLLIAHGLFGSARNWGAVAKRLSAARAVRAVDLRNHGHSPWAETHSYQDLADDLAGALEGPSDVLGHSMGGKAAMVLALAQPDLVRRLIVADIAPVGYGHTQTPLIHAMRRADLSNVTRRSEVELDVPDPGTKAFLLQSVDVEGKRWRLNLDVLEREMDRIIGFPEVSGTYQGPVLFLTGRASDYVRAEHHDRIRAPFPNVEFEAIEGAGHWLHAEKPREFVAAVEGFLSR